MESWSPGLTPDRPFEFELSHQPTDTVATDLDVLTPQLLPDFLGAIDVEVLLVHPSDLGFEFPVAQLPLRGWSGERRVISRRGDCSVSQIGSTPNLSRCSLMKLTTSAVEGGAPSRRKPTPP